MNALQYIIVDAQASVLWMMSAAVLLEHYSQTRKRQSGSSTFDLKLCAQEILSVVTSLDSNVSGQPTLLVQTSANRAVKVHEANICLSKRQVTWPYFFLLGRVHEPSKKGNWIQRSYNGWI